MKAMWIGLVLAGGVVLWGTAAAQYAPGYGGGYGPQYPQGQFQPQPWEQGVEYDDGAQFDWARVVSVDPIVERYQQAVPRQQCWNEPVEYYEPRYAYQPNPYRAGPTLLGALIGGALGNTVGNGDGRKAATIAGAVIGGAVGYNHPGGRYYDAGGRRVQTSRQRCETRTEYQDDDRVVGYNVTYEYNGRTYRTQTDHHPGDRIRVAVQVAAAP